jgi:hypothetical protein
MGCSFVGFCGLLGALVPPPGKPASSDVRLPHSALVTDPWPHGVQMCPPAIRPAQLHARSASPVATTLAIMRRSLGLLITHRITASWPAPSSRSREPTSAPGRVMARDWLPRYVRIMLDMSGWPGVSAASIKNTTPNCPCSGHDRTGRYICALCGAYRPASPVP